MHAEKVWTHHESTKAASSWWPALNTCRLNTPAAAVWSTFQPVHAHMTASCWLKVLGPMCHNEGLKSLQHS